MPKVDHTKRWILTPHVSVGDIKFDSPISQYVSIYHLVCHGEDPDTNWVRYEIPGCESQIFAEQGDVVCVECSETLILDGINLIGLTYSRLLEVVGAEDEAGEEISEDIPLEYQRYGMQVWVSQEWIVDSIMCSRDVDEPD